MLVAEGKKTVSAKKAAPRKQEYAYDVEKAILPHLTVFAPSVPACSNTVPTLSKSRILTVTL
jgi:hypothetical protein